MTSPIKAFVFDWAGTMVDFGSMAPVRALQSVFALEGIDLSAAEARADMGMAKRAHITAILGREPMRTAWRELKGAEAAPADIDHLFEAIGPLMEQAATECAVIIPGAVDLVTLLRSKGVRIGSGTGYSREMMRGILPNAAAQGYAPDLVVCAGETAEGRPSPLMTWKAMVDLGVWPARACVKVDDATVGISEGREAGVWTIGVAASGNGVGLDFADFNALSHDDRISRVAASADALQAAGADYVVNSVADIARLLPEIEERIASGERPGVQTDPIRP
ncbi:Phosphonoacetaldehyde hydrolase [Asticcacaulis sp. MM231]|uniref:phosphonoacetaldehyde hydrolase n=1 Tax=Asticcacaulis sp. MM231 TaxID=3157666 RepID=UPI0032D5797E